MKMLVIDKPREFLNPRNFCIYDQRRRGHMKYHEIAKCHGLSTERCRQIYLKMERLYLRGYFHYENIEE